jgi:hypothetical protein
MILESMFEHFTTVTAEYENKTNTVESGMITGETWTLAGSIEALMYRGSLAERLVSEKIRPTCRRLYLLNLKIILRH